MDGNKGDQNNNNNKDGKDNKDNKDQHKEHPYRKVGRQEGQHCPFGKEGEKQPYYCPDAPLSSDEIMQMESDYAAHNYHPLPIVIERAQGVKVWDPEGKTYFDFLSAYSAVNQGHCHPKILEALTIQAQRVTLTSRAFYNSVFPRFAKFATEVFGYEMILPMNTGAEAVETALKLSRKWGYQKKKIPEAEAIIVCCLGCFHGRTIAIISMSDDYSSRGEFGPYLPGVIQVPYNDINALKNVFEEHSDNICSFICEPIQGEAGVVVPDAGYLKQVSALCKEHNILFIADEVQTGLCRTGKLLCSDWDEVKPDIVVLGKAISGGVLPLSCILANKDIMLCIKPGEHGSTYGGNPLASAVGIAALEVLLDEKLAEKAQKLGEKLRAGLREIQKEHSYIEVVRGKGLLNAIVIDSNFHTSAWDICVSLKEHGLLCKPTHHHIIRLAPPLIITEQELDQCLGIMKTVFADVAAGKLKSEKNSHH